MPVFFVGKDCFVLVIKNVDVKTNAGLLLTLLNRDIVSCLRTEILLQLYMYTT